MLPGDRTGSPAGRPVSRGCCVAGRKREGEPQARQNRTVRAAARIALRPGSSRVAYGPAALARDRARAWVPARSGSAGAAGRGGAGRTEAARIASAKAACPAPTARSRGHGREAVAVPQADEARAGEGEEEVHDGSAAE
jgi:hypothetical protein